MLGRKRSTLFPDYLPRPRTREMAFLRSGELCTQGGAHYPVSSARDIWDLICEQDLSPLFIADWLSFDEEWLAQFLDLGEINCDKRGKPLSQRILLSDHTTRWIQSAKAWGVQSPGPRFLQTLSRVQRGMGIGSIGTPGAAGLTALKRTWRQYGIPSEGSPGWLAHRHPRPNAHCCALLKSRGTGARSDLCTDEDRFEALMELDIKNAYGAALAGDLPAGNASRFFGGDVEGFAHWVGECTVTIREPLIFGLFPVKGEEQTTYPTEPGTYQAWLWNERVDLLRRHGLHVQVGDGYGWWESTRCCEAFVRQMEALRDQAQTPEEADMYKLCLVAAIGALGMEGPRYVLTKEPQEEKWRVCAQGAVTPYFIKEKKTRQKGMPHWMWCVLERVNCQLTEQAWLWREQEMLVATNTDAVLLRPEADLSAYAEKGPGNPSGTWQKRRLTDVTIPALRHLMARGPRGEKIDTRPGVARKRRR